MTWSRENRVSYEYTNFTENRVCNEGNCANITLYHNELKGYNYYPL